MTTQPRKFRKTSGFPVIVEIDKAYRLIDYLYQMYQERRGVYAFNNQTTGPQNVNMPGGYVHLQREVWWGMNKKRYIQPIPFAPEKGSPGHVNWLFFATLTDRRQVSMEVYFAHRELSNQHPELYRPEVRLMNPEDLGNILIKYRVGCPRQSADYWVKCANTLYDSFDWNPLNLLRKCKNSVEKIQEWKIDEKKASLNRKTDPLPGYGPKITSLFTLYLAELKLIEMPLDSFPVDMHVQRIFFQTGVAYGSEGHVFNEEMEDRLRRLICEYANRMGYDKIALSHAFWQLGRTLCTNCYKRKTVHVLCPLFKDCSGPAETKLYFSKGYWPLPVQFMRKGSEGKLALPTGGIIERTEKVIRRDDAGKLVYVPVARTAFQHGLFSSSEKG